MRGMMEILQAKSRELSQPQDSTTPILAERAPVLTRLEAAMNFMVKDIMSSDKTSKKAKFMIGKIWEEALSELEEAPPEIIEESFRRTTALMYWVSTGERIVNIDMPDGFEQYGTPALPAGASDE